MRPGYSWGIIGLTAAGLTLSACGQERLGRMSALPSRPTEGICAKQNPALPIETLTLPSTKFDKPGSHLVYLRRQGQFDIEVIGGGGGGGGAHVGSTNPASGGGAHAVFTSIVRRGLQSDYYLIHVGEGGSRGSGGSNAEEPSSGDGGNGTFTAIYRCRSDALIVNSEGGAGGKGKDPTTGYDYRARGGGGESFVNPDNHLQRGTGGPGGLGGRLGQDGADASGYGAGGGGQGKSDTQNDGVSHGGKGSDGLARITKIG